MATGPQAVERLSEVMGLNPATTNRHAKMLKAHRPALWARSAQGAGTGAKAGRITASHATNLLLSLSADPITSSVAVVTELRDLVPATVRGQAPRDLLPGDTLGAAIDNLIDRLGTSEGRASFYSIAQQPSLTLRRDGRRRTAEVRGFTYRMTGGEAVTEERVWLFEPRQHKDAGSAALAPPIITITFRTLVLETMADMWADTQAVTASNHSSGLSGTKKGAPARAPSNNQTDHTRTLADPGSDRPESRQERVPLQGSCVLGSGSPPQPRRTEHDPPELAVA